MMKDKRFSKYAKIYKITKNLNKCIAEMEAAGTP